jgi:hypothetical protein
MTIRKTLVRVVAALALAGAIGTAAAPTFQTGRALAFQIQGFPTPTPIPAQGRCNPHNPHICTIVPF